MLLYAVCYCMRLYIFPLILLYVLYATKYVCYCMLYATVYISSHAIVCYYICVLIARA
jgi:hypothetical protein